MGLQQVILIYDIADDRLRNKIADVCQDYGLDRVQFSAFQGQLSRSHQQELIAKIRKILREAVGKVQLVPVGDHEWGQRLEISHE